MARQPKQADKGTSVLPQPRLAARLAWRLGRRQGQWIGASSTVFVAGLFTMAMFIALSTLSLSGAQEADRDLGRFDVLASAEMTLPPGSKTPAPAMAGAARQAGANESAAFLTALDVQLAVTPARNVTLLEGRWKPNPYPDVYELTAGRWPQQPGEIVVTDPGDVKAAAGQTLTVLGDVRLRVVGVADNHYATTSALLAAPGTWSGLDPKIAEGYPSLAAQPYLLWTGGPEQAVMDAVTKTLTSYSDGSSSQEAEGGPELLPGPPTLRAQMETEAADYWIEKSPAGYAIPAVLVPIGAVLLMFGLVDRRLRRTTETMVSLGLRPATTVAAVSLACVAWCLAAATAGAAAGVATGWALRPLLAYLQDRPVGDVEGMTGAATQLLALVAATGVLTGAGLLLARRTRSNQPHPTTTSPADQPQTKNLRKKSAATVVRDVRQLAALGVWCVCVVYTATRLDTPSEGMLLTALITAAVVLTLPELFGLATRLLTERDARRRLARRQLQADRRRAQAALAVLTVIIGASLGMLALLDTLIRSSENTVQPDVLPGQVLLAHRASSAFAPPERTLTVLKESKVLEGLPQAELHRLSKESVDETGPVPSTTRQGNNGGILAVDSPDDVPVLTGRPLTADQRALLNRGGLLVWADRDNAPPPEGRPTRLVVAEDERILSETPPLPSKPLELARTGWRAGTDGILLVDTARRLDLPIAVRGPIMVADAGDGRDERVQQILQDHAIDARAAYVYVEPEPPVPDTALYVSAAALALLALTTVLTALRGQTRALKTYIDSLIALGIPPAWGRHIILWQYALLLGTSTLLGLFIAIVPTMALATQIPDFELSIPWGQMSLLLATLGLASVLAATRSTLALRR
ncbi:hypothetical protein [Streptomyces anulatus]|uniref:hypothetical protein n=1 Tax=Streptomyces anulatus TaxID=1892 RepID=UPI00386B79C2|nr:hypothetical protein OG536_25145 [Streptomyces anulatus]